MKKATLMAIPMALIMACGIAGGSAASVRADFVEDDGTAHYGWSLICNEENKSAFSFGADGNISYIAAAEADTATQRVNMYALRDTMYAPDEGYTLKSTFVPDPESDLSAERAYGLVAWYVDGDNYLIYWLQQKMGGDWSGQFYGRVGGVFKSYVNGTGTEFDAWKNGEYNDMWWDGGNSHPAIRNVRNALLTTTVTLEIVSMQTTVTVGGTQTTVRKFELHQIIDGEDFIADTYYVKDIEDETLNFRVGLYSEAFNVGVENFSVLGDGDAQRAQAVEAQIKAIGSVDSQEKIAQVEEARVEWERLLSSQSLCSEGTEEALTAAEDSVGTYVDGLIEGLDESSATFKEDVMEVYELYNGLSELLAGKVTKTEELKTAYDKVQNPEDPEDPEDPENPEDPEDPEDPENPENPEDTETPENPEKEPASVGLIVGLCVGGVVIVALAVFLVIYFKKKK